MRPPLRRLLTERATLVRRATPELRHSWYYLGAPTGPRTPRRCGSSGSATGCWTAPRQVARRDGALVAADARFGAGPALRRSWCRDVPLGAARWRSPPSTTNRPGHGRDHAADVPPPCRSGGVTPADVSLEQMLAAVPDLDGVVARLRRPRRPARRRPPGHAGAARHPVRVGQLPLPRRRPARYPGLELELRAGSRWPSSGVTARARRRWSPCSRGCATPRAAGSPSTAPTCGNSTPVPGSGRSPSSTRTSAVPADRAGERRLQRPEGGPGDTRRAALETAGPRPGTGLDPSPAARLGHDLRARLPGRHRSVRRAVAAVALARALYAARAARGCWSSTSRPPSSTSGPRRRSTTGSSTHPGLTTLVISHRFATVRRAERIAVLEAGPDRRARRARRAGRGRGQLRRDVRVAGGPFRKTSVERTRAMAETRARLRLMACCGADVLFGTAWRAARC